MREKDHGISVQGHFFPAALIHSRMLSLEITILSKVLNGLSGVGELDLLRVRRRGRGKVEGMGV